ncbi:PQQ-dependent sugar dehydrogenase [uncultured Maribacter sp.]|uniref:PQQ-dependent sugar dehydrogenase n=1 Tax=uncultured Maribacter sp. TaxID=431308 RepID=UPI002613B2C1|nr:PQQ-dependent sugar dehydrogenase [uncultured Maribacter sp.]
MLYYLNPINFRFYCTFFLILFLDSFCFSQVTYEEVFPNLSFEFAVELQNSNDGTDRIFVVEQTGKIKVFPNENLVTSAQLNTFLDLSNIISFSSGQEIGLLGLAFHPNYSLNGFFYVYYTRQSNVSGIEVEMVLERYTVNSFNTNIADINSGIEIFSFDKNQNNSNHNGGKIGFGPDGYLYISIGDGGGAGDPNKNSQNLDSPFGSILRIDIDVDGNNPLESNPDLPNGNYEIPSDNPRVGINGLDELYAWGIRNTWKFSFDEDSGRMWGADVGQDELEEINLIEKGGNYGWNAYEGNNIYDNTTNLITSPNIEPTFFYNHNNGDVSITGGYIYKGASNNPTLQGKYIYGDYVSGRVWALNYDSITGQATSEFLFRTNGQFISSFGLDELGELYFSDYGTAGKIYKIIGGNSGPTTEIINGYGSWANLDAGTNGVIKATAYFNNGIYVVGEFTSAGGNLANNIASFSTTTGWTPLGGGTNGKINAIAIANNGNVYIGGEFTSAGGVEASNVAVWDGFNWSNLGNGVNGPVSNIKIDTNDNVYVGGAFTNSGNILVNNIAMWNSTAWTPLTDANSGISGTNNEVRSIAIDNNNLVYVGGNFDNAGGNSASRIATWNGTIWENIGDGTSGFVQSIVINNDDVYVGGNFSLAGGKTVNRIAYWNRNSNEWFGLGNGLSGNVNSLQHDGLFLYAAGNFETASDIIDVNKIVKNIARWNISDGWQALGTGTSVGTNSQINSIIFNENNLKLYTGGNFSSAGNTTASNIAEWGLNLDCTENSIITEYRINGNWKSNDSILTVETGTEIVLSILPNGIDFTIELPDQTIINGDYNLGNVSSSNSGVYTFTTTQGCSESFTLNVVNSDDDNDGIDNNNDQCPNTPPGVTVDSNGCQITIPLNNNFAISTTGNSCRNENKGIIEIIAQMNDSYTAVFSGHNTTETFSFSNTLAIENLASGNYEICITSFNLPNYKRCYNAIIDEPQELNVSSFLNHETKSIILKMSGSKKYNLSVNNNSFSTDKSEITIPLKDEISTIKVSTSKACQGSYEEIINLKSKTSIIYPNPFKEEIHIDLNKTLSGKTSIYLYNAQGKLIFSLPIFDQSKKDQIIKTSHLSDGFYSIHIQTQNNNEIYKLLKH